MRYEAEPIGGETVALLPEHLGSNVLWGSAHAERLDVVILREDLGDAKISDLDVSIFVQQHVLRLEVAVHDIPAVEVLDGREYLRCEVASLVLAELPLIAHDVEQLAPLHVVHQHVDLGGGVEGEVQLHEERVVEVLEDEPLGDGLQL